MDKGVYFVYGCAILVSIVLVFYIWQSSHHIYKSTEPNKTANWCKYSHELWPRTKKVFTLLMVFVLFITSSIYNQFIVLFKKQLFVSVRIGSAVRLSLSGLALRDHSCSCDVAMFTVGASMYEVLYFIHGSHSRRKKSLITFATKLGSTSKFFCTCFRGSRII